MNKRDMEIIGQYEGGLSLREVAKEHELSHERVRQILNREKIKVREKSFWHESKSFWNKNLDAVKGSQ